MKSSLAKLSGNTPVACLGFCKYIMHESYFMISYHGNGEPTLAAEGPGVSDVDGLFLALLGPASPDFAALALGFSLLLGVPSVP